MRSDDIHDNLSLRREARAHRLADIGVELLVEAHAGRADIDSDCVEAGSLPREIVAEIVDDANHFAWQAKKLTRNVKAQWIVVHKGDALSLELKHCRERTGGAAQQQHVTCGP